LTLFLDSLIIMLSFLENFKNFNEFIILIQSFFNSASSYLLVNNFTVFIIFFPLTIIFIIIKIYQVSVTLFLAIYKFSMINFSISVYLNSVTMYLMIFVLTIEALFCFIKFRRVIAINFTVIELSKYFLVYNMSSHYLNNSMKFILIPFSNFYYFFSTFVKSCPYSDSLYLINSIQIAPVIILYICSVIYSLSSSIPKSISDGFYFRLEQPLKLFSISNIENCLRIHLKAIVNCL
jgi:hypothetical protein